MTCPRSHNSRGWGQDSNPHSGALKYMLVTLSYSGFLHPPRNSTKPKAKYLSYLLLQPLKPTHTRGSVNAHFKLWFKKNYHSPSSKENDGPIFRAKKKKVMNPWPTSGPNSRQSQSPSLKLSENIIPMNTKDTGSKKCKLRSKKLITFIS